MRTHTTLTARLSRPCRALLQRGMTLVELMVAMILGLLVTLAAAAALMVSRQGLTAVEASSQLGDNGRFLHSITQKLGVQAGYQDLGFATNTAAQSNSPHGVDTEGFPPYVFGLNNASRTSAKAWDEGVARKSTQLGYGSDILVLRYQTSANASTTRSDETTIDCAGVAPTAAPTRADDTVDSILHIGVGSDGEPALMCSRSATGAAPYSTQPLVSGVENFQVLYGVDGVGPRNTVVPIITAPDSIPERYLRADQLTIAGNTVATYANWRRVRSIRIGIVLRGPPGSAIDRTSQTFYPLGISKGSASGTLGSAFANNTNDPGTVFTPSADGRLRQAMTFTVHLRNVQRQ